MKDVFVCLLIKLHERKCAKKLLFTDNLAAEPKIRYSITAKPIFFNSNSAIRFATYFRR